MHELFKQLFFDFALLPEVFPTYFRYYYALIFIARVLWKLKKLTNSHLLQYNLARDATNALSAVHGTRYTFGAGWDIFCKLLFFLHFQMGEIFCFFYQLQGQKRIVLLIYLFLCC